MPVAAAAGRSGRRRAARAIRDRAHRPRARARASRSRLRACAGSINLKGARIDDLVLTTERESIAADSPPVRLLLAGRRAATPISPASAGPARAWPRPAPTRSGQASGTRLTPATPVTLSWNNGQGQIFEILLVGRRRLSVHRRAAGGQPRRRRRSPPAPTPWSAGPARRGIPTAGPSMSARSACSTAPPITTTIMAIVAEAGDQRFASTGGWLGFTDKYWLAALIPDQGAQRRGRLPPRSPTRRLSRPIIPPTPPIVAPGPRRRATSRICSPAPRRSTLLDRYSGPARHASSSRRSTGAGSHGS